MGGTARRCLDDFPEEPALRTRHSSLRALLLLAGCVATPVAAQQATITGRVLDAASQTPLSGAEVSARGVVTQTDAQGSFILSGVPGRITVRADAQSFAGAEQVVGVAAGATVTLEFALEARPFELQAVRVVSGTRSATAQSSTNVPAAVSVISRREIETQAPTTVGDLVAGVPGVDAPQSGIQTRNIVTRGLNNVFSGSLLVLTDYRYTGVPSLRLNAYNMIPVPPLDIERIEMVLGPASALYGPNSANGIMHIVTTSPIDNPGTSVSVSGGNQSIFTGAFRQAFRVNEKIGLKVSGQYFRGNDFVYRDPAEVATPSNPLIAARDFAVERYGGEARLDFRPWDDSEGDGVKLTYGLNQLVRSIELTGIGAGQARDWKYQYGQVRVRRSGLFAQAFLNASDAGDTYLLRTGQEIVDKSTVLAAQVQYEFSPVDRLDLTAGVDYSRTTPKTDSTITGSNENADETTEYGGYLSGALELTSTLNLVAALRADHHQHLEAAVWSPRVGLVYEPFEGQAFRATYNRAFSTPTTNNLFLDLSAGSIPVGPVSYDIRTIGVPQTGLTWTDQCAGGVNSHCMYSPFAPGVQMPATGAALWDGVVVEGLLGDPAVVAALGLMGLDSSAFRAAVAGPTPAELASVLLRFNHENLSFPVDPGVTSLDRLRPTISTTYELGYQGLVTDRVRLSASVYRSEIRDFVGPLRVETPSVFLDGTSVANFVAGRLVTAGVPAGPAGAFAAGIAPDAAMIPLGTVAPDQRASDALILTYRNFGDVNLWGTDVGFEVVVTGNVNLLGSYSWVSKECFDFNDDGSCSSSVDIALNAPTHKGSFGFRFSDRVGGGTGIEFGVRARYSGEFPMNSGVYVGDVDSYTVFDANVAYEVPTWEGLIASLTVNNVLHNKHQEFIGAPEMGALALIQFQYAFGGL